MWRQAWRDRFHPRTCTCMNSIGRPTARIWCIWPRRAMATTTGTSRNCMPLTRSRAWCGTSSNLRIAGGQCALVARWQDDRLHRRLDERRRRDRRRYLCSTGRRWNAARSDAESKVIAELVPMVAVIETDFVRRGCGRQTRRFRRWIWHREARRHCGRARRA